MFSHLSKRFALLAAGASLSLIVGASTSPIAHGSWTPCDDVTTAASGPTLPPEPVIAGDVWDADTDSGISGATVKLYRCDVGGPTLVSTKVTSSAGAFGFGAQTGPSWYYVEVSPISGMDTVPGTSNPSDPVEVGAGDGSMLFEYES